nr:hypothetical protein Iba_chr07fCG12140 [Ipomoea batatas]
MCVKKPCFFSGNPRLLSLLMSRRKGFGGKGEELLCYKGGEDKEGEDEERGVMISVNEVEGEMEKGSDEKTLVLDVFGDYYDHDCAEIIFSMMNSLSKTSDFLKQGCVVSDEFQEFVEVKGGLKME